MTPDQIVASFREKVCGNIGLLQEGLGRYLVDHPFIYDDGDFLEIALRERDGRWELTDEGTTYMRLTYDIDEAALHKGTRQKIIANTLGMFGVEGRDGQLVPPVPEDRFGDALFTFIQAILKISDVSYLSREYVRSTFRDDLRTFLADSVAEDAKAKRSPETPRPPRRRRLECQLDWIGAVGRCPQWCSCPAGSR